MTVEHHSTTHPRPVSSQFAALEPSWAGIRSSRQLRCLLVLSALLNRQVHVHDTQLADSPHLLADYGSRHDRSLNLYSLLTHLIKAGVATVALRDGTYDPRADRLIPCESLEDLVGSWEQRDPSASWVISPRSDRRRQLVADLDHLIGSEGTRLLRYPYRQIKTDFMSQVRESFNSVESELRELTRGLDPELTRRYDAVVSRPWFSHSTIFSLLREAQMPLSHPLVQFHGTYDEAAYAAWHDARLSGCDWSYHDIGRAEQILGNDVLADPDERRTGQSDVILREQATQIIDGVGSDLLATLTGPEVVALREHAEELFTLQELIAESPAQPLSTIEAAIAEAAGRYWEHICQYLRRTRPALTRQPTQIAIFLRRRLPTLASIAERFVSVGLSSVVTVALDAIPGVKSLSADSKSLIARNVGLEFVFFTDSEGLARLRADIPTRAWVTPDLRRPT